MPYATIRDAEIFYTDEGEGLPLVFVHGWTCDSHDWNWQLPALTGYRRVALDIRGHGRSSAPALGYTIPELAGDIITLMDRLDITRAVLVGHSVGGVIVSQVAVTAPERVAGVVVMHPPYGYGEADAQANVDFVAQMDAGHAGELAAMLFGILESVDSSPALAAWHRRRALGASHHAALEVARGLHGTFDALANGEQTVQLLTARRMPVLAISTTIERAAWEERLLQHPLSRSVLFDGVGHWVQQERPEEITQLLDEWITGLDLTAPPAEADHAAPQAVSA